MDDAALVYVCAACEAASVPYRLVDWEIAKRPLGLKLQEHQMHQIFIQGRIVLHL